MKALSLWQPWASLMMTPRKRFETRSWATSYRGPLLIHAAKTKKGFEDMDQLLGAVLFEEGLAVFPMGGLLGIVELKNCITTEGPTTRAMLRTRLTEEIVGNYGPGRFAWETELIHVFKQPIPFKGKQGLFLVPDDILPAWDPK